MSLDPTNSDKEITDRSSDQEKKNFDIQRKKKIQNFAVSHGLLTSHRPNTEPGATFTSYENKS